MTKFKTFLKPVLSRFSFFIKWISYLFVIQKAFKFFIMLIRFFSYLFSGSFIAAFMVLYDFSSDITDIWLWLINIKDSFLEVVINTYSKFLSKDINLPNNSKDIKTKDIKSDNINNTKSQHYKSLRSDNGYKHSVPENDSTPLYKDWRVWLAGAVVISGALALLYFYSDALHFGSNPDPKSPGSSSSSDSIAINTSFGPTIGPELPKSSAFSPDSPVSTTSDSTPKVAFKPLPLKEINDPFKPGWNDPGPSLLTSKEKEEFNKYFQLPKDKNN